MSAEEKDCGCIDGSHYGGNPVDKTCCNYPELAKDHAAALATIERLEQRIEELVQASHAVYADTLVREATIARLEMELNALKDMVSSTNYGRNNDGFTLLDFYIIWRGQDQQRIVRLEEELKTMRQAHGSLSLPETKTE